MAKAYRPPEGLPETDITAGWDAYNKACDEYEEKLREWCKQHTKSKSDLVGEVYTHPVADGQARYMVFNTKPLELIHIETCDAYGLPEAHIRGLRLADIKERIDNQKALRVLFRESREAADV